MSDIANYILKSIKELLAAKSIDKPLDNQKIALVDELGLTSMELSVLIARFDLEFDQEPFAEAYSITDLRTIEDLIAAYEGKELS